MAELPDGLADLGIEEARLVRLEPGDVVVLTHSKPVTQADAAVLVGRLGDVFAGHRVLVLDGDMSLEVLREGGELR